MKHIHKAICKLEFEVEVKRLPLEGKLSPKVTDEVLLSYCFALIYRLLLLCSAGQGGSEGLISFGNQSRKATADFKLKI